MKAQDDDAARADVTYVLTVTSVATRSRVTEVSPFKPVTSEPATAPQSRWLLRCRSVTGLSGQAPAPEAIAVAAPVAASAAPRPAWAAPAAAGAAAAGAAAGAALLTA